MLERSPNRQGGDSDEEHLLEELKPTDQDDEGDGITSQAQPDHQITVTTTPPFDNQRPLGLRATWLAIMMASSAALITTTAVLIFLWSESHRSIAGGSVSGLWQTLRDPGRLFVTLTVSAMIIRIAIAAQTGILTTILASILLRRYLVPLEKAPGILMMRATRSFDPGSILSSLGYKRYWGKVEFLVAGRRLAYSTRSAGDIHSARLRPRLGTDPADVDNHRLGVWIPDGTNHVQWKPGRQGL